MWLIPIRTITVNFTSTHPPFTRNQDVFGTCMRERAFPDRDAAILTNYSRRNVALILAQCEERGRDVPQAVAGFHDWRKAGRTVRKGAKGLAIFRPRTKKDADTGEETRTGYAIAYVFDVADTDPIGEDSPDTLRALMGAE